ncbi:hypothetical protein WCP94_003479 [Bilophila wadsworthia]
MLDTSTQEVCVGSYHLDLDREVQRTRCLEAVFRAKGALLNSPQRMNTERLRCFCSQTCYCPARPRSGALH